MSTNGKLKNKATCLLSTSDKDQGKILSIGTAGKLELLEPGTESKKIILSSDTEDFIDYRKELYLPMDPVTKENFLNNEIVFIYDKEKEYKQTLFLPWGLYSYNEDYLFFTYISLDRYFNIIQYQENFYYNFTSRFTFDTSLKFNLIFKGAVNGTN